MFESSINYNLKLENLNYFTKYIWVQLLKKEAIKGKQITPIDQNCSNSVTTIVFGFPPVMSETVNKSEK